MRLDRERLGHSKGGRVAAIDLGIGLLVGLRRLYMLRLEAGGRRMRLMRSNLPLAISRAGALLYMLARSSGARTIVEFGTSYGVSTLYLAAAMRDEGGGLVIGTEIEPEKARHARIHFAEAGVADLIELREGDALVTLKDCGGPVDFLLVDGFPKLARPIIALMAPQLRKGAIVVCDNVGHFPASFADYLDFVRRPANGFVSTLLPLRGGTELSVKT